MSKQALDQVIQRASSDARFRDSLNDNFDGAIRSYDLSDAEKAQLAKGLGISRAVTSRPMPTAIAATVDAASVHASTVDASSVHASTVDASTVDASTVDASTVDASTVDASTVDASTVDASTVDASTVDASTIEASSLDLLTR
jgi:hypothetical protein